MVNDAMGIQGIQIIGMFFCIVMLYLTFLHYKRKEFKVEFFLFWAFAWIGLIIMILYPTSLDFFVRGLKFGRRLDFFIVFGSFFILVLQYYNYIIINNTRRKVEKITRKIAIQNHNRKN